MFLTLEDITPQDVETRGRHGTVHDTTVQNRPRFWDPQKRWKDATKTS